MWLPFLQEYLELYSIMEPAGALIKEAQGTNDIVCISIILRMVHFHRYATSTAMISATCPVTMPGRARQ